MTAFPPHPEYPVADLPAGGDRQAFVDVRSAGLDFVVVLFADPLFSDLTDVIGAALTLAFAVAEPWGPPAGRDATFWRGGDLHGNDALYAVSVSPAWARVPDARKAAVADRLALGLLGGPLPLRRTAAWPEYGAASPLPPQLANVLPVTHLRPLAGWRVLDRWLPISLWDGD